MRGITCRGAIQVFYYLMASDGEIHGEELDRFDAVGGELDPDGFASYREELVSECAQSVERILDSSNFEVLLLEHIDIVLQDEVPQDGERISPSLFIWDLLVVAQSEGVYSAVEQRIVRHIARSIGFGESQLLEFEQCMLALCAIEDQLAWVKLQARSFDEIEPIVWELELRHRTILREVAMTIADDPALDTGDGAEARLDAEAKKLAAAGGSSSPDIVDGIGAALGDASQQVGATISSVGEAVMPVVQGVGDAIGSGLDEARKNAERTAVELGDTVAPVLEGARESAGKALGDLQGMIGGLFGGRG